MAKSLKRALAALLLLTPAWLFAAPRVITLSPSNTELAFAAGITPVGVSSHSDYPPEAAKIEQVSSWQGMNLERIVALKPDLVIAWRGGNAERQVDQLASLGIKVMWVDATSIEQIANALRQLAPWSPQPDKAEQAAQSLLDQYAQDGAEYAAYHALYRALVTAKRALDALTSSEEEKQRRIAELSEEIDTIDAAALTAGEEERLMERRKVIMHAQGILDGLTAAHQALSGDDSGEMMGAADLLGSVVNELAESARLDESLAPLSERLSDLYYGARELATDLADRLDGYDFDPGELDQIEERLDQIYRMKQRYGASVEELLTRRDKAAEELEGYQSSGKRIAELTQRKQELYRQTKAAAETLTQARLKAFTSMNRQMREALEFLNMPGVRMVLRHQRGPLASAGQDNIEFLISTNPGEEPKPLAKIASGGELSRIMLAFKSALADKDAISTVIYDEIDTGVSGLAAGRIGQKLKQTASGHQVLCITHTPQIAAFADNQLLIEKKVRDNRTFTEIHPLDLDGRVQVLARMISGDKVTDLSLANARELIEKSQG